MGLSGVCWASAGNRNAVMPSGNELPLYSANNLPFPAIGSYTRYCLVPEPRPGAAAMACQSLKDIILEFGVPGFAYVNAHR